MCVWSAPHVETDYCNFFLKNTHTEKERDKKERASLTYTPAPKISRCSWVGVCVWVRYSLSHPHTVTHALCQFVCSFCFVWCWLWRFDSIRCVYNKLEAHCATEQLTDMCVRARWLYLCPAPSRTWFFIVRTAHNTMPCRLTDWLTDSAQRLCLWLWIHSIGYECAKHMYKSLYTVCTCSSSKSLIFAATNEENRTKHTRRLRARARKRANTPQSETTIATHSTSTTVVSGVKPKNEIKAITTGLVSCPVYF